MENNIAAIILESIRPELSRLVEEAVLSALSKARQVRQYPEKVGVEQASEITGYTKNSLYQMHSRGQIPSAVKLAAKEGMQLRSLAGGFCQLENRVTLGQEESDLLQKTADCARKLCTLERTLRWRARERKDLNVADKAWRAYATARYALRMSVNETMQLWSGMTLGLSVLEMPYFQEDLDALWHIAHMPQGKLLQDSTLLPDVERAKRVRALFSGGD